MKMLFKIIDRVLFYALYRRHYIRKFKGYGNNVRWGRDFERLIIPKNVRISCSELIEIGDDCSIDEGVYLQCHRDGGGIEIGNGARINAHTHIQAFSKIRIEDKVLIAPFCLINSGVHGDMRSYDPIMDQPYVASGPIQISRGCWLGRGAQILGGVNLGANVTVGAGSVVTKSFDKSNSVIAGVPSKLIKVHDVK